MARVLVVDDNSESARLLGRLLTQLRYDVTIVNSGEAALDALRDGVPHLVILDLMMPGIDGAEVLRRMRERQETSGVPVAMFSAADDPDVRNKLLARGAQDFWIKGSFDFQKLRERVECLLAASGNRGLPP